MTRSKLILSVFGALVVCLGLGYAWGASGRFAVQGALDAAQQQLDLAEARGRILEARVSLYNMNFGDASSRLEDSKVPLRRVRQRYQDAGRTDAAAGVDAALRHVEEAQRLSGKLDQAANSKAGEALEALKVAATSKS
jgi:hypothetical protein